jgi:DnaJ-domain-containing protein 1
MHLPGRLRLTTLGDLLGALHRGRATGTLELVEDRGRSHKVHLSQGRVIAVEVDGASPSLAEILRSDRAADDDVLRRSLLRAITSRRLHGEVLVDEFHIAPSVVGGALRRQVLGRLAALEQLADARISFRVAVRHPRGTLHQAPLEAQEFLHGRRRARPSRAAEPAPPESAWQILGVSPGADATAIKRAYRRLARTLHPDLHPDATLEERRALAARFSEITEAYRSLVA